MSATLPAKPAVRPRCPNFSSGPCGKRPGWSQAALAQACLARSHRSRAAKAKLVEVLDRSRAILGLPAAYRIGIVAGSDTGAVEMALWSLLGSRGVDMLAWESFGKSWLSDVAQQLRLPDLRRVEAPYGRLPDLAGVDFSRDVVFTWNGTTSGVRVPDGNWIPDQHEGLAICDATSAVFAMPLPWDKLDVVTWSWQKALGGEGAHGMIALSPAAIERLTVFRPDRPLPKVFRLTRDGKLIDELFEGFTINSPSMLAVEDALVALDWCIAAGGLPHLIARSRRNLDVVRRWVSASPHVTFLAEDPRTVSSTSICLKFCHGLFDELSGPQKADFVRRVCARIEENDAGYDIGSHREAPPGIRIWGGPTVDPADIELLLPWVDWAFAQAVREFT